MHYVTSDIHGYPLKDFQRLLSSAGFSEEDELFVLGDVIDRNGDGGIAMLRWMMTQENVFLILGNHEQFLLLCDFLFEHITDDSIRQLDPDRLSLLSCWMRNGCEPTLKSLRRLKQTDPDELSSLLDYLRDAPLYDIMRIGGKTYILTHAGLGHFSPDRELDDYSEDDLLWNRPKLTDTYYKNAVTVFGHTPTLAYGAEHSGRLIRSPTWIDIDTGAAAGLSPMLLRLEDEKAFYCDDLTGGK